MKIVDYKHEYTYDSVHTVSQEMGEHNDCAVRAVCLATRTPYPDVHRLFIDAGRRFRGKTKPGVSELVLSTLGVHLIDERFTPSTVNRCEYELQMSASYLIWVRGHILAMIDGKVQDWTKGRRHRPLRVSMVTGI